MSSAAERVLRAYPQIFFACHVRHIPDPRTKRLLTSRQREVLDHLSDDHSMGMRQLAAHMGVTSSTMSITIDRLVQRGYVVRDVANDDRRRVELRLTQAGVRLRGAQEVLDAARVSEMLERLSPSDADDALRGLETLADAARRMMEARAAQTSGQGKSATFAPAPTPVPGSPRTRRSQP
jgi:DNA-binding MarR family transcriptional regulator